MIDVATLDRNDLILSVDSLVRHFPKQRRSPFSRREIVHAVDGVSFHIRAGESLGLVGESGCGKSTTGRIVVGIDQPTAGSVTYKGVDLSILSKSGMRALRCDVQMIFQNPLGALDPRINVGRQIREPLDIHDIGDGPSREAAVLAMLDAVGMSPALAARFPHELSGGQAQRVVMARALIIEPDLIVCDEPVSALDVSVQAQVVALLAELQKTLGIAYLFISHDLKVVKQLCHRIAVMYLGQIVEEGPCEDIFRAPHHPYTRALISAIPIPDPTIKPQRIILRGDPPSPLSPPSGCRFHTRCPQAMPRCAKDSPRMQTFDGRSIACHLMDESDKDI